MLFADDTSIIITIKEVLQRALNKTLFGIISWFKDSFLSFNFDKMHNLKIWTINYIDTTLRINLLNKTMANIPYTKLLCWMVDGTLTWDNYNDQFFSRLKSACYAIRVVKAVVSVKAVRMLYFSYAHSIVSFGIIFFGSTHNIIKIFRI